MAGNLESPSLNVIACLTEVIPDLLQPCFKTALEVFAESPVCRFVQQVIQLMRILLVVEQEPRSREGPDISDEVS